MTPREKSWEKLLAAARLATARDESAPFGFSTRVAARAFDAGPPQLAFGRAAFRALALSGILAAAAVAANYSAILTAFDDDSQVATTDDPVAEVVDLGS